MNKFLRLLVSLSFAVIAAGLPERARADIWLEIFDGTTTHSTAAPKPGFNTGMQTDQPTTPATMPFLTCAHPCTVAFPSGTQGGGTVAGDTLLFRDASSAAFARIIQTNSSTQRLELKGLRISAVAPVDLKQGRTLKVTFGADKFSQFPAGSYPWAVTFGANFTKQLSGTPALTASCPDPFDPNLNRDSKDPCARLRLYINGEDADKFLPSARPDPLKTVSIPCDGRFQFPCGGGWYKKNGGFRAIASGLFEWDSDWDPFQKVELTDVYFNVANQTHSSINSAIAAISTRPEEDFGVEVLFHSLARELDGDFWVYFSAASHSYFPPKEGVTLTSIVTPNWSPLQEKRNKRSYASFIAEPSTLQWSEVKKLSLNYDFFVGRDGDLMFSDCSRGSFYLLVALEDKGGKDAKKLKIHLGSSERNYTSGCDEAADKLNEINLMKSDEPRIEEGISIKDSQKKYGDLDVRSISLVVDQGGPEPVANYKVRVHDIRMNGIRLAQRLGESRGK